jgi:hypothetical protein
MESSKNSNSGPYKKVLFLDAGSFLLGPLSGVDDILERESIFLVQGQDRSMLDWIHPGMLQYFGEDMGNSASKKFLDKPSFHGGTQGYNLKKLDVLASTRTVQTSNYSNPESPGPLSRDATRKKIANLLEGYISCMNTPACVTPPNHTLRVLAAYRGRCATTHLMYVDCVIWSVLYVG